MRSKFKWIFALLLALSLQFSFAQEKTVSGVVSDDKGTLPGANVVVKGTTKGVQTDFDGKFSIKVKQGETLVFSFIGMQDQEKVVGASNTINVKLSAGSVKLEEVVVEGYKSTTKAKATAAVTTISSKTIKDRPNASFIQTLQGQVSGLNIATGSGQPGANSTVILRGLGSVNGNVEPLYVVDGVPLNVDNFRSINPADIESISVLKDAGATSIYGNRGANGVIVVKTKKADYQSSLKISYLGTTGFTDLQKNKYNVMDTNELLAIEAAYGDGLGSLLGTLSPESVALAKSRNTDWKDYFFRTGVSQNHVLNLSSGSQNLASFTSLGYFNQQGILKNTDLNRFNFRNNLNGRSANNRFNYSTNTTINYSRRNEASNLGTGGVNQNFVLGANNSLPYITPDMYVSATQVTDEYFGDSTEIYEGSLAGTLALTPLFLVDKLKTFKNVTDELKMIASGQVSYDIRKNLTFSTQVGMDFTQQKGLVVQPNDSFNTYVFLQAGQEYGGFQQETFSNDFQFTANSSLRYDKSFGKSNFVVAAFLEYNKSHFKSFSSRQNGINDLFFSPGNGSGFVGYDGLANSFYVPNITSAKINAGLFSYFGTLDYDYDSRFGLGATIRRDASFRFIGDNKWGTFWSVSGRWNLNKESFMENSIFNLLKLRGSYGTSGNQLIVGQNVFNGTTLAYNLAASGNTYSNQFSYLFAQLGNPSLKWETVRQANVGIDAELFKGRIKLVADVYEKRTEDLYQEVPVSAIVGEGGGINANLGVLRNRGVELDLSLNVVKSNADGLNIILKGNGAYNKNEIVELPQQNGINWDGGLTINRVGGMLNELYLVRYAGVNPANGNLLFLDKNGVPTETPTNEDRVYTGKSSLPIYQGSFGFDISYKGFFMTTQFNYAAKVYRFDYDLSGLQDPNNLGQFNVSSDLFRSWTTENRVTDMPSLFYTNQAYESTSDRNVKDASYIRLRNFSLGYNFPNRFLDKSFITGLRLFVQAENYFTWTKWRGWDAESNRGADQYQYPTPKIFSVGLELHL